MLVNSTISTHFPSSPLIVHQFRLSCPQVHHWYSFSPSRLLKLQLSILQPLFRFRLQSKRLVLNKSLIRLTLVSCCSGIPVYLTLWILTLTGDFWDTVIGDFWVTLRHYHRWLLSDFETLSQVTFKFWDTVTGDFWLLRHCHRWLLTF